MKSKIWIFYLIMNIVLVGVIGFLSYRMYTQPALSYPDPVTIFEEEFPYGEKLKIMDPLIAEAEESDCLYSFSFKNDTEEEKAFYLYLQVSGDQIIIDNLTVKVQEKNLLINYLPNSALRKIILQPNESASISMIIYIDLLQVIDSTLFIEKNITIKVIDDQAAFYGIERDNESSQPSTDDKQNDDNESKDQSNENNDEETPEST